MSLLLKMRRVFIFMILESEDTANSVHPSSLFWNVFSILLHASTIEYLQIIKGPERSLGDDLLLQAN